MSRLILPDHIEAERQRETAFAELCFTIRDCVYAGALFFTIIHFAGAL